MMTEHEAIVNNKPELLCCPFCGGTDLTPGYWSLDDGEVDSVECDNCYAGAPVEAWNKRDNADAKRIDWLADPEQFTGSIQLPKECVEKNLHSLRAAIDAAMEL